MTVPEITPLIQTERTLYSSDNRLHAFREDDLASVASWVEYILWECSTEFMASVGMPTTADIRLWIAALEQRVDVDEPAVQQLLCECRQYIQPQ